MYMAEDYNSPQSVYWCLKSLIVVGLDADHEFWSIPEVGYPEEQRSVKYLPAPEQILCNHPKGHHHFLLSPGQFVAWPMKANQAKYCKFAYSSTFAFSVPTGPLIQQIAPDNTLALSRDGAETWAVKWKCDEVRQFAVKHDLGTAMAVSTRWYPWGDRTVIVDTLLVPPTDQWPDWHVRAHRIYCRRQTPSLHLIEGGFAIYGRENTTGKSLQECPQTSLDAQIGDLEGILSYGPEVLIASKEGLSGISALSSPDMTDLACYAMKPDANTNLACTRTLIPVISHRVNTKIEAGATFWFAVGVFAMSSPANSGRVDQIGSIRDRWKASPNIRLENLAVAFDDVV
jgi:hypothetical protein